jgi:ubiquinol-cytochrome c reductase iron-sulfur subunit
LILASSAVGGVGALGFAWTLVDSMNPAADVLALATVDVNLAPVQVGQAITVMWRGQPIFIRRRTAQEIKEALDVPLNSLKDPQEDKDRAVKPEWLVVVGVCTHLGCVPLGQKPTDNKGDFGGWFCPCHGSQYDTSGRIRLGPAPTNLDIPPYEFISETIIRIGQKKSTSPQQKNNSGTTYG